MIDMDKDHGPEEVGMIMGICVASYQRHNVTREELLHLVGEMFDGIAEQVAEVEAITKRGLGEVGDDAT